MDAAACPTNYPPETSSEVVQLGERGGGEPPLPASCAPTSSRYEELDRAQVDAAIAGDSRAIEAFIRFYQQRVVDFVARSTGRGSQVEDLAQEVFLKVFRALPRFEWRSAKISTWIFRIAVRVIVDDRKRTRPWLVEMLEEPIGPSQTPEEICGRRRELTSLERCVEALPAEQRFALVLVQFHGLSLAEVGQVMNCTENTVKTRVHRARAHLRSAMSGKERF